jgi:phage terminase Nu1 subunit (DNA packaging protein)
MPRKKAEDKPTKQPGWLNKKQMAASIGISPQAFDRWGVGPVAKIGRETFFLVSDVLNNREEKALFEEEQKDNLGTLIDPAELEFQRFRKTKAEADKIELANEVTRREQAPVALLEWALASLSEQISSVLDAIPGRIKKRVPHLKANELAIIEHEVTKCRNAGAKTKLPWDQLEGGD